MKQHEREYFISRVRTGIYYVDHEDIRLKIYTPSIDDEFYIKPLRVTVITDP